MNIFSSGTLSDWKVRGITDVSFFLVKGGCAGEKIQVQEGINGDMDMLFNEGAITFHVKLSEWDFLREGKITKVGEKWILSNKEKLTGHCSCGSSFQRKTGNPILDKAEQIRLTIKQKTKYHT